MGITSLSFFPLKSQSQNIYGKINISKKTTNNSFGEEVFGNLMGIKTGIGTNISKKSRVEISTGFFDKLIKEGCFIVNTQVTGNYDVVLKINEKFNLYFGPGIGVGNITLHYYNQKIKKRFTGFAWGSRAGIEIKTKQPTIYFEIGHSNINGKAYGKNASLFSFDFGLGIKVSR